MLWITDSEWVNREFYTPERFNLCQQGFKQKKIIHIIHNVMNVIDSERVNNGIVYSITISTYTHRHVDASSLLR